MVCLLTWPAEETVMVTTAVEVVVRKSRSRCEK